MSTHALRTRLREKAGALEALKAAAFADTAKPEEKAALKAHLGEMEVITSDLDLAEQAEAAEAKAAKPAELPVGAALVKATTPALVKVADPNQMLSLTAAAIIVGKSTGRHPLKVLDDEGYGNFASELGKKTVNTLVPADGGVLVPTPLTGGIMPILRGEATFVDANPVRVPLTNGQFVLPRGLAGATASYIAEGALKPVSSPTFDSVSMRAKKLAGIVPVTNEARSWTVGDIENYVRTDLRSALAITMDLNAYLGTGAGSSPLGILNKVGVQTVTVGTTGTDVIMVNVQTPTIAELDALANRMILRLTTAKIFANDRWRWLMSYRTAMKLQDMRDGNGNAVFPTMELGRAGGTLWKGFPVIISSEIPTTGGGTTDETILALIDWRHVLFGEEEGITMKMSDQATLNTTGAVNGTGLLHLWQMNMFALLAEAMHDFGLRTPLAVVKSTIRF